MAVRKIGKRFYVYFKWRGTPIHTVTAATRESDARRIDKAVQIAFRIQRFDHLNPDELDFVLRTFEQKQWVLPPELQASEPEEEVTLMKAAEDYFRVDEIHRTKRNVFALDRVLEHFGQDFPMKALKISQIKAYRAARLEKVQNATVNREVSVLSGIFQTQVELEALEFNPCRNVRRLPENERDSYLSWVDFNVLLEESGWIRSLVLLLYYTGMRFNEAVCLRWEMFKPERRMFVLPASMTKEGKNPRKIRLRPKRIPLRQEAMEMLEYLRIEDGGKIVKAMGLVFGYSGKFHDRNGTYVGKPIDRFMVRKCWDRATKIAGVEGLGFRDLRHTWKTNAQRSGMDETIRNAIVGHSNHRSVADRYISVSDEVLLTAVDSMSFDNGQTDLDWIVEAKPEHSDQYENCTKNLATEPKKVRGAGSTP